MTICLLGAAQSIWPQDDSQPSKRAYQIHRLAEADSIKLDAILDEAAWARAEVAGDFIQSQPHQGGAASYKTEVRLLYDDRNIYIGATCWQDTPSIAADLHRDFSPLNGDFFEVALDTFDDGMNGFVFSINPKGAMRDLQIGSDGGNTNTNWNGVWDVKCRVAEDHWVAELVIPFKSLRFHKAESQTWGLNFTRWVRTTNESSYWSEIPQRFFVTKVSLAGSMVGLDDVVPGRNLKLKPFVTGSAARIADRVEKPDSYIGKAGLDLKYGLTSGLTLDFSANTDFSQVEADLQQTNITRFSLFFPEKREFFLENANIFHLGEPLASSSGTSRSDVMLFYSRRIGLTTAGNPIPLLGGVRLSGRIDKYDVGILNMQAKEFGDVPANNFTVARFRRNILSRSDFGAMFVSRQATGQPGSYNRALGLDTNLRIGSDVGMTAFVAKTESPGLNRKDWAGGVNLKYQGARYRFGANYGEVQPNFNAEVGYVRRTDMRTLGGDFGFVYRPENFLSIREIQPKVGMETFYTTENCLDTRQIEAALEVDFHSGATMVLAQQFTREVLVNGFEAHPDRNIPAGDYRSPNFMMSYTGNRSRKFSANLQFENGGYYGGGRVGLAGGIVFRPNAQFNFQMNLNRNRITDIPAGDFSTNLMNWRVNYAFSRNMLVDTLIQYNSKSGAVSSMVRFDLIHHPLSDLFIVYNENRDRRSGRLVDRIFAVKFTQLFDF